MIIIPRPFLFVQFYVNLSDLSRGKPRAGATGMASFVETADAVMPELEEVGGAKLGETADDETFQLEETADDDEISQLEETAGDDEISQLGEMADTETSELEMADPDNGTPAAHGPSQ